MSTFQEKQNEAKSAPAANKRLRLGNCRRLKTICRPASQVDASVRTLERFSLHDSQVKVEQKASLKDRFARPECAETASVRNLPSGKVGQVALAGVASVALHGM
jgi:hypothetical protein